MTAPMLAKGLVLYAGANIQISRQSVQLESHFNNKDRIGRRLESRHLLTIWLTIWGFKTTHYSSSPFSNKLFLSSNSSFTNKFFHQTALSSNKLFLLQPAWLKCERWHCGWNDCHDGCGNAWQRLGDYQVGKCTTPTALGQEKKKTYRPDLLWEN